MGSDSQNTKKPASSVEILKSHMEEVSIRNLDTNWIRENRVDLGSLMEDKHHDVGFKYDLWVTKSR